MNARSVFARGRCLCALTGLLLAGPAALPAQSGGDGRRSHGDESGHVIRIIPGPSARDRVVLTSHTSTTTATATTADQTVAQPLLRLPSVTPRNSPHAMQLPVAEHYAPTVGQDTAAPFPQLVPPAGSQTPPTMSVAQQSDAEAEGTSAASPFLSSPPDLDAGPTAAPHPQVPSRMAQQPPRRIEKPSLLDRLFGRWMQPPANPQHPHPNRTAQRELPPAPQHQTAGPQEHAGEPDDTPGLLPDFVRFPKVVSGDEPRQEHSASPSERPLRKNVPPPPEPGVVRQAAPGTASAGESFAPPLPGVATDDGAVLDFDNPFHNVPAPEETPDAPSTAAPIEVAAPEQPDFRTTPLQSEVEPVETQDDQFMPPVAGDVAVAADRQRRGEHRDKMELIAERSSLSGLKGFCPVELRDQRDLVDADPAITATFEGTTYTFSSEEAKAKFQAAPEKYAPVDGGSDIILTGHTGTYHAGSLDHAIWYQGRLHLFSNHDSLETFLQTIESEVAE